MYLLPLLPLSVSISRLPGAPKLCSVENVWEVWRSSAAAVGFYPLSGHERALFVALVLHVALNISLYAFFCGALASLPLFLYIW
jgi:hypothetical protein